MNIIISANTSWNLYNFRLNLMKDLRDAGYKVFAVAPYDDSSKILIENGFEFIELKSLTRKGSNPLNDIRLMNEYKKIYKIVKPDFVFLYTIKPVIYGNLATYKTNIFSISTITGLGYTFLNKNIVSKVAHYLYRISLNYSDVLFFQNEDDKHLFEQLGIIKKNKAKVINGSGIDTTKIFSKIVFRDSKTIKLVYVGRMLVDKGVDELLKSFHEIADNIDIELHLVGGLDKDNPAMVNEENFYLSIDHPKVKFYGDSKNVVAIMDEMDIVVLPSYREGIPKVLLEAFCLSKPIIATDVPGCRQVVDHNINGLLCEAKSVDSLKNAILHMISLQEEDRQDMGRKGRRKVEDIFDQKMISQIYLKLIEDKVKI